MSLYQGAKSAIITLYRVLAKIVRALLVLLVIVVIWRMASAPPPAHELTLAEFMQQVQDGDVRHVNFETSGSAVEITGELQKPKQYFRAATTKEALPDLADRLHQAGIATANSTAIRKGSLQYYVVIVGLILFGGTLFVLLTWVIKMLERRT